MKTIKITTEQAEYLLEDGTLQIEHPSIGSHGRNGTLRLVVDDENALDG